jgi:hypothetical protein
MRTLVVGPQRWGFAGRHVRLPESTVLRLARADAARRLRARFALRVRSGGLLARLVGRYERVVAPSTAALELFSEARALGVRTVLVEDIPDMRGLHRDLDAAAARHPDAALLRRFRAPSELVARQEQERLLADRRLVFSALGLARDSGAEPISTELNPARDGAPSAGRTVLLAGPPLARAGVIEAARACEVAGLRLVARSCETKDAAVEVASEAELALQGVAAVLAPAWAESWPRVTLDAARCGIPVIATAQGAGLAPYEAVACGDVDGLVAALQRGLGGRV